jgi:hypothetical protein
MKNFEIVNRRLANQHLTRDPLPTPTHVVQALGAVQAQDYAGARWALAQRMGHATDAEIEKSFDAGEILRTHVLRPTWHFITPNDIRWLLELTAPRVHAFNAFMYRRMELDSAVFKKSSAVLEKTLHGGKHKTRAELAKALDDKGIATRDGVRLGLLLMHAELEGLVCSGPRRGKQFTYALLAERAPRAKQLNREEALYELSRRYFSTRGPATAQDFAWWSGLKLSEARKGVEMAQAELHREQVEKQTFWYPASAPPGKKSPTAHLLPNYDEYFIGYQDRRAFGARLGQRTSAELNRTLYSHLVFIDGQIVGRWRRTSKKEAVRVEMDILTTLTAAEQRALTSAAHAFATFVGAPLELVEESFNGNRRTGLFK